MIAIDLIDETENMPQEQLDLVERLLQHTAKEEGVMDAEMSVTFTTNEAIQAINAEFRGKNVPTDVISFAMEELGDGEMEIVGSLEPRMLGDIVISVERTEEQAADYGHSFERELGFLAVHGFLHLMGYDHMDEAEEKTMFGRQEEILTSFGLTRDKNGRA